MISAQVSTQQIHEVISWNDATVIGILIAFILAFGLVIIFLFKTNQTLYKEFIIELKANNEALIKVNNFQNEFVNNMVALEKRK
jgi:hypothetical protein